MGDLIEERALRALSEAFDATAPVVRHDRREFPEGTPFLSLRLPGSADAAVFLDDSRWIYLSEPERGRMPTQFAAGRVDDDPELVVRRLVAVLAPPRGDRLPVRLLKAFLLALIAGLGVGMLSVVIMAVLIAGNGYLSETAIAWAYGLGGLFAIAAGGWTAVRWWRAG
ncbi:hypothetical protein ACFYSC_29315 [Streptosporangium sp. NPDC004379]|uniref:hypothetical protein n=1 Tax=Streptosporangium sp. NPDC004379 TaxID=3366189 RepID=UPI0036B89CE9